MTITTHLIGISNPSIQSILILSSFYWLQQLLHPGYIRLQDPEVKSRAKYFPSFPTFYSEGSSEVNGIARPVRCSSVKPQTSAIFV